MPIDRQTLVTLDLEGVLVPEVWIAVAERTGIEALTRTTRDEPDYDAVEMLYIDPEECIDCDACVEACPVDACFAEDQLPGEWQKYAQVNADYFTSR